MNQTKIQLKSNKYLQLPGMFCLMLKISMIERSLQSKAIRARLMSWQLRRDIETENESVAILPLLVSLGRQQLRTTKKIKAKPTQPTEDIVQMTSSPKPCHQEVVPLTKRSS